MKLYRIGNRIIIFSLWFAVAGTLSGWSQTKVLFLGNSQLSVYDGITGNRIYDLPGMIKDISESAPPEFPRLETYKFTYNPGEGISGGKSLKKHWDVGEGPGTPRAVIANGDWDYVVIQEIYRLNEQEFQSYASKFDEAIRKAGARTILFATAHIANPDNPYFRPYPEATEILNGIQVSFGKKLGIPVAAAGYAWMKFLGPDPTEEQLLDLYRNDKSHPGYKGSYIYACLLYATITGRSPIGLTSKFGIDSVKMDILRIGNKEALRMQRAAWDQHLENLNFQDHSGIPGSRLQ